MQNLTKRLIIWAIIVVMILTIPLVAMQFTNEVDWGLDDFIVMGSLLFGTGLAYELVAKRGHSTAYRVAVGVAVVTAFLLTWVNLAVGIIGDDNPANLMYFGVLVVGLVGAGITGLRARGMERTLVTMACAQMLVPVIALIFWSSNFAPGVLGVFTLNAFFALLWLVSALLFQRARIQGSK